MISTRRFHLLSVRGIDIGVDLSWSVLALLVALSLAQGLFPDVYDGLPTFTYWVMAVLVVIGLGVSIILHELAHSFVAAAYGTPVRSVTLFVFGGAAALDREPNHPKAELLMALAGPLMSLALGIGALSMANLLVALGGGAAAVGVFRYLGIVNIALAVFNLIPAFPMDGGRALRAILWARSKDLVAATTRAAKIGEAFGVGFMMLGLLSAIFGGVIAGLWWILIGAFIRTAASGAAVQVKIDQVLTGVKVQDLMTPNPDTVSASIPLSEFVDHHLYQYAHDLFPVMDQGQCIGMIGLKETKSVPRDSWSKTAIADVMTPISEAARIDQFETALSALQKMRQENLSRLVVTDGQTLVGIATLKDFMRRISLDLELKT